MKDPENSNLEQRLRAAESAKAGTYDKRTEHIGEAGKALFINRLVLEDSPYLLQHAHNPVNWYPWGEEAFAVATRENKPVFLSIGYSTCHWCHVMEVESFDNVEVAKVLNEHFVSIKMDREQYPDIDEIYMTAVQLISGHGGWPMSNFLLPDGKPFFAATYFPPENFLHLLDQIRSAWVERFEELQKSATSVHSAVQGILGNRPSGEAKVISAKQLVEALGQREDTQRGGLSGAPKFPQEPILLYLLEYAAKEHCDIALGFVRRALRGMGQGGIYDQVAGGFHRYSVDEEWLVPHFEKMLYNQSQLSLVYLRAWQMTREPFFARICRQTLGYVLRDMELPEGGYYSATDADSEGAEGTFFLWSLAELETILPSDQATLITDVFSVSRTGNFEGSNILHLSESLDQLQEKYGAGFLENLDRALATLYEVREQRIHPIRDDKRIVAWCAAMASSLIQASAVFDVARWLESARKAIDHIVASNVSKEGELTRIYLEGETSIAAQLEDYVNLIQALLLLFDYTESNDYLQRAQELMAVVIRDYWDQEEGCFYLGPAQQQGPVLVRSRSAGDGAELSAVATALECLWMLEQRKHLAGKEEIVDYQSVRNLALSKLQSVIDDNPLNHCSILRVQSLADTGSRQAVQYANGGLLRAHARRSELVAEARASVTGVAEVQVTIHCKIDADWHLTAAEATQADYSPLSLSLLGNEGWELLAIQYPSPTDTIESAGGSIPICSGEFTLGFTARRGSQALSPLRFRLHYQLCDDRQCLLPGQLDYLL